MKAVVFEKYGPPEVLMLKDIAKPEPNDSEVLIKIHATSVSAGDWRMRKPSPFLARLINGLFKPNKIKILGFELSGEVEQIGSDVKGFKLKDKVIAFTGFGFGAYAQYICMAVDSKPTKGMITLKPSNLSYEQAAVIPTSGLTAYVFVVRTAKIKKGKRVLIYGASGSVGSYALQMAKHFGAHVTGVCSGANLEMIKALGVDEVLDYKKEDFTKSSRRYDIIYDAVGKLKASRAKKALAPGGRFFSVMKSGKLHPNDLERVKELAENDHIRPYIDKVYSLEEIVDAHRYVERGHKKGNVAVMIKHDKL